MFGGPRYSHVEKREGFSDPLKKKGYRKDESAKDFDEAYQLALRKKCTLYDSVFVPPASDLGLELKTFDVAQKGLSNGDTINSSSD